MTTPSSGDGLRRGIVAVARIYGGLIIVVALLLVVVLAAPTVAR
jgi:hypothetical protein